MRRLFLLFLCSTAAAWARTPQPTVCGTLVGWKDPASEFRLHLADGSWKTCRLTSGHELMREGLKVSRSYFQNGQLVVIRVRGNLDEKPAVSVDCLADLNSSPYLVCHSAPAPYYTHSGDYATTNGAGGRPDGVADPTRVIGILGHGGQLDQGMPHSRGEAMASVLGPLGITPASADTLRGLVVGQPESGVVALQLADGQTVTVRLAGDPGRCLGRMLKVEAQELSPVSGRPLAGLSPNPDTGLKGGFPHGRNCASESGAAVAAVCGSVGSENFLPEVEGNRAFFAHPGRVSKNTLEVEGLSKTYGRTRALDQVSLAVPEGSAYGILGPNGSGKTTLLGLVLGILRPDSGSFRWRHGGRLGALLETPNFYPYLSGADNLSLTASIRGVQGDVDAALKQVGLLDARRMAFEKYSLGMKQRLAIAATLLGGPPVVVLDEPTNGLDPSGIAEVRDVLKGLIQERRTVLLASHLLDEVEKVSTHVAILKKGRVLEQGEMREILRDEDALEMRAADPMKLREVLEQFPVTHRLERTPEGWIMQGAAGTLDPARINRFCFDQGLELQHLMLRKKSLEAKFLEVTDP